MHHVTSCKATYVRCMRVLAATSTCTFGRTTGLLRATAVNTKITSRTCRFETCRYLQMTNFKTHFVRTGHIFNFVPQSNQSSPPSLSLTHARMHARTHAHTRTHARTHAHARTEAQNQYTVCLNTESGSQANCEISSSIFQALRVKLPIAFRHFMKCLTFLGIS